MNSLEWLPYLGLISLVAVFICTLISKKVYGKSRRPLREIAAFAKGGDILSIVTPFFGFSFVVSLVWMRAVHMFDSLTRGVAFKCRQGYAESAPTSNSSHSAEGKPL